MLRLGTRTYTPLRHGGTTKLRQAAKLFNVLAKYREKQDARGSPTGIRLNPLRHPQTALSAPELRLAQSHPAYSKVAATKARLICTDEDTLLSRYLCILFVSWMGG
jgi:hypothetical protein